MRASGSSRAVPFAVTREPDDKLVPCRASIGGGPDTGFYLVFRGDPEQVVQMLEDVLAGAREALPAGDYTDKRGRPQG